MAEQNTPPGGRPGRPFIPPFRGPSSTDNAGAPTRAPVTPERAQPRPFVPPSVARPVSPVAPLAPMPPAPPAASFAEELPAPPAAPDAPAMSASPPSPPRPKSPVHAAAILDPEPAPGMRDLANELADELAEELSVEHAISETIGQGTMSAGDSSLELERASVESPDALPGLPSLPAEDASELPDDGTPSGGPELAFLMPDEDTSAPTSKLPWVAESETVAAVEEALSEEAETASAEESGPVGERGDEVPSSSEPLPWLAAPAEESEQDRLSAAHVFDEVSSTTRSDAPRYDSGAMRHITPPRNLTEAAMEASEQAATMVVGANLSVAEALERVAHRIRNGELRVPAIEESVGDAGALAAALAVLLGVRR